MEDSLNGDENLAPGDVEDLIETLRDNYHMAHMSTPEMVETDGF